MRPPNALLWVVLALIALGVAAGLTAEARTPAFALRDERVYRLEVGVAVFIAGYLVLVCVRLALTGQLLQKVGLPGGASLEAPAAGALDDAAAQFAAFQTDTAARLDAVDAVLADHEARIVDVEDDLASRPGEPKRGDG